MPLLPRMLGPALRPPPPPHRNIAPLPPSGCLQAPRWCGPAVSRPTEAGFPCSCMLITDPPAWPHKEKVFGSVFLSSVGPLSLQPVLGCTHLFLCNEHTKVPGPRSIALLLQISCAVTSLHFEPHTHQQAAIRPGSLTLTPALRHTMTAASSDGDALHVLVYVSRWVAPRPTPREWQDFEVFWTKSNSALQVGSQMWMTEDAVLQVLPIPGFL